MKLIGVTLLAFVSASAGVSAGAAQPPIEIRSRLELFVDHYLIDKLDGVELRLGSPRRAEVAIRNDRPWEGPFSGSYSVFEHQGKFHMYYRGYGLENVNGGRGVICHAVSDDGVTWIKPKLGLAEVAGTRDNNVIVKESNEPITPAFFVWLDTRPKTPDDERIKGTYFTADGDRQVTPINAHGKIKRLGCLVSADGARFHKMDPPPRLASGWPGVFDSVNVFFWSPVELRYVCYFRFGDRPDGGTTWDSIGRTTSADFIHWSEPAPMTYGRTPREHLYTNQTTPYFRAPHLYIALPARFMAGRRVLTDAQVKEADFKSYKGHTYYNDCSDAALMSTRAGTTRYDRTFMESFVRPGIGLKNWGSRTNYPVCGILQTSPDELSFYVSRHYAHDSWHIRRYTLRLDGFASVHAPYAGGEMLSKPFRFTGKQLLINYSTSAPGGLRVEIQNAEGSPVPGFTLADCPEIVGNEIERTVSWKQGPDVSRLAGKPLRLRFSIKDADLYSIKFR